MTPLATTLAKMTAAQAARTDKAGLHKLIGQDLHCFDVTAIGKAVTDAMDADNLWPDAEDMLPGMFLPSPVTWLEMQSHTRAGRCAFVVEALPTDWFRISMVLEPYMSVHLCDFRSRPALSLSGRVEIRPPEIEPYETDFDPLVAVRLPNTGTGIPIAMAGELERLNAARGIAEARIDALKDALECTKAEAEVHEAKWHKFGIVFVVLTLDLINTPGLVGLKQHAPHRGLAKRLGGLRSGRYPLHGWSEIVLKHQTTLAGDAEQLTGVTYHKCLHFVRSHRRRYKDGRETVVVAHWRGDPALGIKRTRYKVAA